MGIVQVDRRKNGPTSRAATAAKQPGRFVLQMPSAKALQTVPASRKEPSNFDAVTARIKK